MICRREHIWQIQKWSNTTKKTCSWNNCWSLGKIKLCKKLRQMHYAKKSFLMVYVGMYDCYENIKIYKKKMIIKFVAPLSLFYLLKDTKTFLGWTDWSQSHAILLCPECISEKPAGNKINHNHDPKSNHNQWKSKCNKCQWCWVLWYAQQEL